MYYDKTKVGRCACLITRHRRQDVCSHCRAPGTLNLTPGSDYYSTHHCRSASAESLPLPLGKKHGPKSPLSTLPYPPFTTAACVTCRCSGLSAIITCVLVVLCLELVHRQTGKRAGRITHEYDCTLHSAGELRKFKNTTLSRSLRQYQHIPRDPRRRERKARIARN